MLKIEYDNDEEAADPPDEDRFQDKTQDEGIWHGSAFYTFFKAIYDPRLADNESEAPNLKNVYYAKDFVVYVLEHLLPHYSLWSAVILIDFGLYRDSNATAENWFKTVKVDVFKKMLRNNSAGFIQQTELHLLSCF